MTAATARQSRTEGQGANGTDTVTMTPTATAIVQTKLALTNTMTTMGTTDSNEKCKLYPRKAMKNSDLIATWKTTRR